MKPTLILLLFLKCSWLFAQRDSLVFDANYVFKNGIYTSFREMLLNSPKYPNVEFELKNGLQISSVRSSFTNDSMPYKHFEHDSIFSVVKNGKMYIHFENEFCKLITLGSISTFYRESSGTPYIVPGASIVVMGPTGITGAPKTARRSEVFYLDLKTGFANLLTSDDMDVLLKSDYALYTDFSLASPKEKRKTLYSYVLRYNARNPFYLPQ